MPRRRSDGLTDRTFGAAVGSAAIVLAAAGCQAGPVDIGCQITRQIVIPDTMPLSLLPESSSAPTRPRFAGPWSTPAAPSVPRRPSRCPRERCTRTTRSPAPPTRATRSSSARSCPPPTPPTPSCASSPRRSTTERPRARPERRSSRSAAARIPETRCR